MYHIILGGHDEQKRYDYKLENQKIKTENEALYNKIEDTNELYLKTKEVLEITAIERNCVLFNVTENSFDYYPLDSDIKKTYELKYNKIYMSDYLQDNLTQGYLDIDYNEPVVIVYYRGSVDKRKENKK